MIERATSTLPEGEPVIITSRLLNAPRDVVWAVLTSPDHLKHFWGPDGFTNTFRSYDLRVGGEARFTMHGPDGKDWPNRFVFLTIEPPGLLRWQHDNGGEGEIDHRFTGELELKLVGGKTRIELRVVEPTLEVRDVVARFAVEGGIQNLERLAAYVAPHADEKLEFVIERTLPVSQQRLFEVCTNADEMLKWFVAPGHILLKSEQDFRPGGTYHYGTGSPEGQEMWGLVTYREIKGPERIVYSQSFSDRDRKITSHPMAPTWPTEMITTFEFVAEGPSQTKLKITWVYAGTDDAEAKTFSAAHDGMRGGWTSYFDRLQAFLAR